MSLTKVSYSMINGSPVNVLDYGAIGDGTTDSTSAISTALNSGASEVVIPQGTFIVSAITVTSSTLRRVSGPGTLKLKNAANTFMLTLTGTNELVFDGVNFDGNKANQSGGTSVNRSSYILINLTDATTVGTQFRSCKFSNAYYGAVINNGGIRTLIDGCWFYSCGMTSKDGTCDAIFNGTSAQGTRIVNNWINDCSDYGVACDTSGIIVQNNVISNCFAGVGSLTRGAIGNHTIQNNDISLCTRPIDYFNSVSDSAAANRFSDIWIDGNRLYSTDNTGAMISFAANNATLKLCQDVRITNNVVNTYLNGCSAIGMGSATGANNTNIEISSNIITGDNNTQSSRYAINIANTDSLVITNNTVNGVDLGVSVTTVTGECSGNNFVVLRDVYTVSASQLTINELLKNVARNGILVSNASTLSLFVEFVNVAYGIRIYDNSGALPANTIYINSLINRSTTTNTIYVDGTLTHKVALTALPAEIGDFTYNTLQTSWNINQAPTTGSWVQGQLSYQLSPTVGQSKGWMCTVTGTPGTWVTVGNL